MAALASAQRDEYLLVDAQLDTVTVASCPCCGSRPELWQYVNANDVAQKIVMCSVGEGLVEEDDGCLLFMPPRAFYQPTRREAIAHWNAYADALAKLREAAR